MAENKLDIPDNGDFVNMSTHTEHPDFVRGLESEVGVSGMIPWAGQYAPGVVVDSRQGFEVLTGNGERCVDQHQGILSMSMGWANPAIEKAISDFHSRFSGVDMVDTTQLSHPAVRLKLELVRALKPYGDFRALLAATGTSANNQALRLCMGALGGEDATQLIVMEGGYGGADLAMNALCEAPGWRGVTSLESGALVLKRDGSNFDEVFKAIPQGKKPIWHTEDGQQGVGGFHVLDAKLLQAIAEEVTRRGGLKIYDNVQAFVRNGAGLIGLDRWGDRNNPAHRPDAVTFAKGLGNGRPVAAAMISEKVLQAVKDSGKTGNTFDTFSQPTDGLISGIGVLQMAQKHRLWENVAERGEDYKARLADLPGNHPAVQEVFGQGGLIGIRLATGAQVIKALELAPKHRILFAKGGSAGEIIRAPLPFNATEGFVEEATGRMREVLAKVA